MRLSTISPTGGSHRVAAFGLRRPGRLVLATAGTLVVDVGHGPTPEGGRLRRAAAERSEPWDAAPA